MGRSCGAFKKGKEMKELWLCGQYRSGDVPNVVWDLQGIFSTKERAISACKNRHYFIAPIKVDEEAPDETETMPGVEYPLTC
jgi:hypothetical protein